MLRTKHSKHKSLVMPKRMYWFTLPALVLFVVFWIVPILQLFLYSVTNFNGIDYNNYKFVGFDNFIRIINEGSLTNAIKNTLVYTGIIVVFSNVIGLALALALNSKIKGKTFFRIAAYLPALFSAIVIGFIWSYVYMPGSGLLSSFLNVIGLDGSEVNILAGFKSALYGISVVDIWKNVGTTMIIYLAGLQTLDEGLVEAGRIDGCSGWQLIRRIKLPLISATITINVILNVIAGLKAFDFPFIMTNGGPGKSTNTLMYVIYKMAFNDQMMGKASAFSVVAFFVIILITIVMLIFMNRREVEL